MTLLDIIQQCPTADPSVMEVWVENNAAYDFKGSVNSILLISQPFGDSDDVETLKLSEIIDFTKELDLSEEDVTLSDEYEMEELKSCEWHENKLILYFS